MKSFLICFVLFLHACIAAGQSNSMQYDSTLAKSLGADEYGMKSYVLVILKTGKNDIQDKIVRDSLFKGHMANIGRLADEGKLVVAGPISKNELNYRGIFILNVPTIEEARELLQTDPTIKENVFELELFKWYGSAALPEYLKTHKSIQKSEF